MELDMRDVFVGFVLSYLESFKFCVFYLFKDSFKIVCIVLVDVSIVEL